MFCWFGFAHHAYPRANMPPLPGAPWVRPRGLMHLPPPPPTQPPKHTLLFHLLNFPLFSPFFLSHKVPLSFTFSLIFALLFPLLPSKKQDNFFPCRLFLQPCASHLPPPTSNLQSPKGSSGARGVPRKMDIWLFKGESNICMPSS